MVLCATFPIFFLSLFLFLFLSLSLCISLCISLCDLCDLCERERCVPLDSSDDLGLARIVLHPRCLCVCTGTEQGDAEEQGEVRRRREGGRKQASTSKRQGGGRGRRPAMQGQREAQALVPASMAVAHAVALFVALPLFSEEKALRAGRVLPASLT